MTQHNKQARQTFHCFVLNSHFIQPSECLFVCQTASIFYSVAFQILCPEIFIRTVDLSRENRVTPPTLRFSQKRIEIIFRGRCRPRKLKSAKNNPHIFETKPRKFGDTKISHYTVCEFHNLGTSACGVAVAVNDHRMRYLYNVSIYTAFRHFFEYSSFSLSL